MVVFNNAIAGAAGQAGGAAAGAGVQSLRFGDDHDDWLSWTPSTNGDRKTWSFSTWIKLCGKSETTYHYIFSSSNTYIAIDNNGALEINLRGASTNYFNYAAGLFIDYGAWYHMLLVLDTRNDSLRLYINGVERPWTSSARPTNQDLLINSAALHGIGKGTTVDRFLNGYLADVRFLDGQVAYPEAFAELDGTTNTWQPVDYVHTANNGTAWHQSLAGTVNGSYVKLNAFDGREDTVCALTVADSFVFTPPSPIPYKRKVEVYVEPSIGAGTQGYILNSGTQQNIDADGNWREIATGEGTITSLEVNNAGLTNGNIWLSAIRVDGVILRSSVSQGGNSFYLNFADNSSVSALGTDASGNGNDWDVNNVRLDTTTFDYVSDGTSSGTWNNAVANFYKMFNGNLTDGANPSGGGTDATWTFGTALTNVVKARAYISADTSGQTFKVNNLTAASTTSFGWITAYDDPNNPITVNSVTFTSNNGGGNTVFAIEINDVILVSTNPANNDWLRESPKNGDPSVDTGLGGQLDGNYCTWNPIVDTTNLRRNSKLTNGNLKFQLPDQETYDTYDYGTMGVSSGKWYYEITLSNVGTGGTSHNVGWSGAMQRNWTVACVYLFKAGQTYKNGSQINNVASSGNGDVIGVALDADNNTVSFYKNGQLLSTETSFDHGTYFPFIYGEAGASRTYVADTNFGQYEWAHPAPSGYKAICTANLTDPGVVDSSTAFDILTYGGNGSARAIGGLKFQPDLVWIKRRNSTQDHRVFDAIRGVQVGLTPNSTSGDYTATGELTAFNSDGFSLGTHQGVNLAGNTYVAFCWDGGDTFSNASGANGATIASSGYVNENLGMSLVTYTGISGTAAETVSHGLSTTPQLIFTKNRSRATNWVTYSPYVQSGFILGLDVTLGEWSPGSGNYGTVNSQIYTVNRGGSNSYNLNQGSDNYVSYCFTPREGVTAMGTYRGTGNGDAPFQWCGFAPRFIMIKAIDTGGSNSYQGWSIYDTKRHPSNFYGGTEVLYANRDYQEGLRGNGDPDGYQEGFIKLSNGFKPQHQVSSFNIETNESGIDYLWIAFAEAPFKYSRAR